MVTPKERLAILEGIEHVNDSDIFNRTSHEIAGAMIRKNGIPWYIDCSDYHPENRAWTPELRVALICAGIALTIIAILVTA